MLIYSTPPTWKRLLVFSKWHMSVLWILASSDIAAEGSALTQLCHLHIEAFGKGHYQQPKFWVGGD